jgi:hypothetical protein
VGHSIALSRRELLCGSVAGMAALTFGATAATGETVAREDLAAVFRQMGLIGTFAALDVGPDRLTLVNAERANVRFVPASTFKIPNTLIALETGALRDADEMFRYDGKPRAVKAWERDMTLREAITVSNVPVYQELARRIGLATYRVWLDRLAYGNRDASTALEGVCPHPRARKGLFAISSGSRRRTAGCCLPRQAGPARSAGGPAGSSAATASRRLRSIST